MSGYIKPNSVAVLMSIYEGESPSFFEECLLSIESQTFKDFTLYLVIDGPITLELSEILRENAHSLSMHIIKLEQNIGLARALNHGLTHIESDFIIRMDSDDIMRCDRIEQLVTYLSEYHFVGSNVKIIDDNSGVIGWRKYPADEDSMIRKFLVRNPFCHPSIAFRRSVLESIGGYPIFTLKNEDTLFFLSVIKANYKLYNIQEDLLYFRETKGTVLRRAGIHKALGDLLDRFKVIHSLHGNWRHICFALLVFVFQLMPKKIQYWIRKMLF